MKRRGRGRGERGRNEEEREKSKCGGEDEERALKGEERNGRKRRKARPTRRAIRRIRTVTRVRRCLRLANVRSHAPFRFRVCVRMRYIFQPPPPPLSQLLDVAELYDESLWDGECCICGEVSVCPCARPVRPSHQSPSPSIAPTQTGKQAEARSERMEEGARMRATASRG
jgi:hypothetical protein